MVVREGTGTAPAVVEEAGVEVNVEAVGGDETRGSRRRTDSRHVARDFQGKVNMECETVAGADTTLHVVDGTPTIAFMVVESLELLIRASVKWYLGRVTGLLPRQRSMTMLNTLVESCTTMVSWTGLCVKTDMVIYTSINMSTAFFSWIFSHMGW